MRVDCEVLFWHRCGNPRRRVPIQSKDTYDPPPPPRAFLSVACSGHTHLATVRGHARLLPSAPGTYTTLRTRIRMAWLLHIHCESVQMLKLAAGTGELPSLARHEQCEKGVDGVGRKSVEESRAGLVVTRMPRASSNSVRAVYERRVRATSPRNLQFRWSSGAVRNGVFMQMWIFEVQPLHLPLWERRLVLVAPWSHELRTNKEQFATGAVRGERNGAANSNAICTTGMPLAEDRTSSSAHHTYLGRYEDESRPAQGSHVPVMSSGHPASAKTQVHPTPRTTLRR